MPRINWGERLALGVAYLALLVIVFGASYGLVINGYAELHKAYATYQATADSQRDTASDKIENACFDTDRAKFSKCFRSEMQTYYEQQATNQDLQAQQDMGFWAAALFILGIGQAVLSAIGIVFIWQSLALNRDAVKAAVDAVHSDRAWITPTPMKIMGVANPDAPGDFDKTNVAISRHWKNTGNSPAFIEEFSILYRMLYVQEEIPIFEPKDKPSKAIILASDDTLKTAILHLTDQQSVDWKSGKGFLFLYCRVKYKTGFASLGTRHTEVCTKVEFKGKIYNAENTMVTGMEFSDTPIGEQNSFD